jgi:LysR family glycine cleavage system transcriptional activator
MSRRSLPLNAIDAFLVNRASPESYPCGNCLTQGAVSRKLRPLTWFGFPLFERHARAALSQAAPCRSCNPLSSIC